MKDNWEKVNETMVLDDKTIRDMVRIRFGDRKITSCRPLSGGLSNSLFKIEFEVMNPVVLRVYSRSASICRKETEISSLVRGNVPVPEVHKTGMLKNKPFALVEWVDGMRLSDVMKKATKSELEELGYKVGTVLADIHRYRFPKPGFFGNGLKVEEPLEMGPDMFRSFIEESLFGGKAGKWLGKEASGRLWQFVSDNAELLAGSLGNFTLTHSDFNPWNLLIDEKIEVAAVLDWEFAFSASSPVDIGNMLRYEPDGSPFEKDFIRGFQENGGALPKEWRKLSKLNDLIALVDLLNRSDSGVNRIADLKQLIEGTMANWNKPI
ncbi:MAG TPA: aminoglycoside phosphotransferase family protein [Bacillales bacterium]|nr:aminoglycoside phosphotransferase family protein [Bacillales bacterium]